MLSKRLPIEFIDNKELTLNSFSSLEDEPEKTSREAEGQNDKKAKKKGHSQLLVNLSGISGFI
jgi:ribosome-binding ATPase YchF (GTP1/OBG family)